MRQRERGEEREKREKRGRIESVESAGGGVWREERVGRCARVCTDPDRRVKQPWPPPACGHALGASVDKGGPFPEGVGCLDLGGGP